ncbi:SCO family protein [Sporosarcina sp. FSL K6-3457]|uniref:SCO family protein n=1 Tax=Sporosarcina sp. FSL K6-3457 TaxID=2978204 RepID=UPI0030F9C7B0
MNNKRYNALATILVLVFGFVLFYVGTDQFSAFTAETARVNKLVEEKPQFPDVTFEDSEGRTYSIDEFKGKYVFITFIYSMCTTVCIDMEMNMDQVYELIPEKYMGKDIQFLSISFDPERDDPERLDAYKNIFTNSDGELWRMARIENQAELDFLLDEFGVIVIPDEYGNFAHNSAFYVVDRQGTLVEVLDYKKIEEAANTVISILDEEAGV